MRILFVHDYGTAAGGAERITLDLRDGMRARGHDARLFSSAANALGLPNEADYLCHGATGWSRRFTQVANPGARRALERVLAGFRPDLVHLRMFLTQLSPSILAPLRPLPTLLHVGGYHMICPINTRLLPSGKECTYGAGVACYQQGCVSAAGLARTVIQHRAWRRHGDAFDMVVANSHDLARQFGDNGVTVDRVIWNGTRVVPERTQLADVPTVTFSSRLVVTKGAEDLVRAMADVVARVPSARAIIAGEGIERSRLEQLARTLGVSGAVSFPGHLDRESLADRLRPGWVHAVPTRVMEPFTNSLCEGLMRGTAVVASRGGGTSEVLRDGETGFLIDPGDANQLADRLVPMLSDRGLAERMGARAREFALRELATDRMLDAFEQAYTTLRLP